jgi:hypothetical protein
MKIGISQRSRFLPTEDEIRSDDPEFLPSTDLDQPCFLTDAMAPHLDTHFRLLRHDIFRELKEALGESINSITYDPTSLANSKLSLEDMRAYPYANAHIAYVLYRNRGIEGLVSFNQLQPLRKKSASDRRKWWEGSNVSKKVLCCALSQSSIPKVPFYSSQSVRNVPTPRQLTILVLTTISTLSLLPAISQTWRI